MFVVAVAHWRLRPWHAVALAGTSRAGAPDLDLLRLHSQPRAGLLLLDAGSDTIHLMTRPRSQVLIYLGLLEAANAHADGGTGHARAEAIIEGLPVLLFVIPALMPGELLVPGVRRYSRQHKQRIECSIETYARTCLRQQRGACRTKDKIINSTA